MHEISCLFSVDGNNVQDLIFVFTNCCFFKLHNISFLIDLFTIIICIISKIYLNSI